MSYSSVFRSVATVTVLSVITRTLAFLFKIYLSRAVGAEILGLYQICLSVFFLFISLTSGGLTTVLSRKIAESDALGDKTGSLTYLTASLAIGMTAAAVSVGALYLFAPYATVLISDERALPLLRIMLPALLSTTFYIIIRGWFWGTKQFGAFSVTELIEEVLRILCTLLLVSGVVSGINGATGIAVAFTVSDVIVAIIVFVMFLRKGGKFRKFGSVGEMLKPSAPLTVMRVFGSLVGTALALILPARLIAGGMSVSEATASVGRIAGMANPLLFAPNAIIGSLAIVLIPEMSADNVRSQSKTLNEIISSFIGKQRLPLLLLDTEMIKKDRSMYSARGAGIIGFSTAPLAIASLMGMFFCLLAFIMIIVIIVRTLLFGDPTSGWPSMVCIIFLCSGVQLFCMGVLGQYLAKTYLETKHRPVYITRETEEDLDG